MYDLDEYGPQQLVYTFDTNVYINDKYEIADKWALAFTNYIVHAIRWVSTILLLLGCPDYLFMLVLTVHLLPAFLFLNLYVPLPLKNVLIYMSTINHQSLFIFANIDVGYEQYSS